MVQVRVLPYQAEQKEKRAGTSGPLSFYAPELVVLREHEGEAPDFVRDEP
jgi:hypothetical protein